MSRSNAAEDCGFRVSDPTTQGAETTIDIDEAESWYNEETGEVEAFDSLVDDERWKYETLTDLYNQIAID